MDKKVAIVGLLTIITVLVVGIFWFGGFMKPAVPKTDDSNATPEKVGQVVAANNQFAFDLYSKYKSQDGNMFFSPYSISTALAMTYEGARGKTAEEMQAVLHFPTDDDVRRAGFAKIHNDLNKPDKKYILNTANALWAQNDFTFLDGYFGTVGRYYGGKVTNLDFKGKTEESRVTINKWVEEQTNNRIKDLIPSGVITEFTRLVLTNAVYFKGDWILKFDKGLTKERDFKINPAKTVKTQMMSLTGENKFNYVETDDLQILEMPYVGNEVSMLILLPKEGTLDSVESSISSEKLSEWKRWLREELVVEVDVPKFKFDTKYFLTKDLVAMGMPTAFARPTFVPPTDFSGANFTSMTGECCMTGQDCSPITCLFITDVIHQAFVEVNEEGTEAAAATAVVMGKATSAGTYKPRYKFIADHPFIFLIQDKTTGTILFLGRVSNPTKG